MTMFKKLEFNTPEEYINAITEPDRKKAIAELFDLLKKELHDFDIKLWGNIIGLGSYHYKYDSGREGDWFKIGLANQKNYMSLYICETEGDKYIPEKYQDKLGKVSVGKSCIRFKKLEDLNLDEIKKLLSLVKEKYEQK